MVYWGPGEAGKTTNYLWLKRRLGRLKASTGFSIQTSRKRTLWADTVFLRTEFNIGAAHFLALWQVVTATGQERFLSTREFVLAGADGVIFVADATPGRETDNTQSFRELVTLARGAGIPVTVQLNKTDIIGGLTPEDLARELAIPAVAIISAVAVRGEGVLEAFMEASHNILTAHFNRPLKTGNPSLPESS